MQRLSKRVSVFWTMSGCFWRSCFLPYDRLLKDAAGTDGEILFRPDLTQVCVDFAEDIAEVIDFGILVGERFDDSEGVLEVVARAAQGTEIQASLAAVSDGSGEILLEHVAQWVCGVQFLQDLERSADG